VVLLADAPARLRRWHHVVWCVSACSPFSSHQCTDACFSPRSPPLAGPEDGGCIAMYGESCERKPLLYPCAGCCPPQTHLPIASSRRPHGAVAGGALRARSIDRSLPYAPPANDPPPHTHSRVLLRDLCSLCGLSACRCSLPGLRASAALVAFSLPSLQWNGASGHFPLALPLSRSSSADVDDGYSASSIGDLYCDGSMKA